MIFDHQIDINLDRTVFKSYLWKKSKFLQFMIWQSESEYFKRRWNGVADYCTQMFSTEYHKQQIIFIHFVMFCWTSITEHTAETTIKKEIFCWIDSPAEFEFDGPQFCLSFAVRILMRPSVNGWIGELFSMKTLTNSVSRTAAIWNIVKNK